MKKKINSSQLLTRIASQLRNNFSDAVVRNTVLGVCMVIDKACGQDAWILAKFFFYVYQCTIQKGSRDHLI